jgi:hypothetical protein
VKGENEISSWHLREKVEEHKKLRQVHNWHAPGAQTGKRDANGSHDRGNINIATGMLVMVDKPQVPHHRVKRVQSKGILLLACDLAIQSLSTYTHRTENPVV